MSAAKPILYVGDENSEIDNYIKENNIGWSYNWKNEKLILPKLNEYFKTNIVLSENEFEKYDGIDDNNIYDLVNYQVLLIIKYKFLQPYYYYLENLY